MPCPLLSPWGSSSSLLWKGLPFWTTWEDHLCPYTAVVGYIRVHEQPSYLHTTPQQSFSRLYIKHATESKYGKQLCHLDTVSVGDDGFLLEIANKAMAKTSTYEIGRPKQSHEHTCAQEEHNYNLSYIRVMGNQNRLFLSLMVPSNRVTYLGCR